MAIRNNRFKRSMLMYVVKNVVYCIKELARCPARVASFFSLNGTDIEFLLFCSISRWYILSLYFLIFKSGD